LNLESEKHSLQKKLQKNLEDYDILEEKLTIEENKGSEINKLRDDFLKGGFIGLIINHSLMGTF